MATGTMRKNVSIDTQPAVDEILSEGMKALARKLIQHATSRDNPSQCGECYDAGQEILLDLEMNGLRCLLIRQPSPQEELPAASVSLSPRELEIARMIAKGYPNKTIAAVLEISAWTVCTHIRRIFAKLGVGSRAAMVARLSEEGAIGEDRAPSGPYSF